MARRFERPKVVVAGEVNREVTWEVASSEAAQWSVPADVDWTASPAIAAMAQIQWVDGDAGARVVGPGDALDERDWWFRTRTQASHLRLESLSFPAQIYVDGVEAATSRSAFLPVEVDLPGRDCEVAIACRSLTQWLSSKRPRGRWRSSMTGAQGLRWARVSLVGRVAAYAGGPPDVGFSGLVCGPRPLLRDVIVGVRLAGDGTDEPAYGEVQVSALVDARLPDGVVAELLFDGKVVAQQPISAAGAVDVRLGVDAPQLWWPRGYGDPACYELRIADGTREYLRRTVGFREVAIDRCGGAFAITVNQVEVFARGAVLTGPADASLIDALADAGATMVRVAGGTTPASAEVWEQCARRGIMVWHDSMLSTFDLPDELYEVVADELRSLLSLYGANPALVAVCGGSETQQQPEMMGLEVERRGQPLIEQILPGVVDEWISAGGGGPGELHYVTSSPTSGAGLSVLRPDDGPSHWFGVGGYRQPVASVTSARVRFASECLAFANPPDRVDDLTAVAKSAESWKRGVPKDRGADWDFEDVRDHYVAELFGVDPEVLRRVNPARYLDLGRAAVAEAMSSCFARWRNAPDCAGALVLSAHDLQQGAGWGLVDYLGQSKAPLRAVRRVWAPVTVTVLDDGLAGLTLSMHNDSPHAVSGWVHLRATNKRGQVTVEGRRPVHLAAHSSLTLHDDDVIGRFTDLGFAYRFGDPVADALDVRLESESGELLARAVHLVVAPAVSGVDDSGETRPVVTAVLDRDAGLLRLSASATVRWVSIDLTDFEPADDYFHLVAGLDYAVAVTAKHASSGGEVNGWPGVVRSIDLAGAAPITEKRNSR